MNRKDILEDILYRIAYNGGRVNIIEFKNICQMLYGRTEAKVVEYFKLLEVLDKIKIENIDIVLCDMSRVKAIWKIRKENQKHEIDEESPEAREADDFLNALIGAKADK